MLLAHFVVIAHDGVWLAATVMDDWQGLNLCCRKFGSLQVEDHQCHFVSSQVATIPTFPTSASILLPSFISSVVIKPPGKMYTTSVRGPSWLSVPGN